MPRPPTFETLGGRQSLPVRGPVDARSAVLVRSALGVRWSGQPAHVVARALDFLATLEATA